MRIRVHRRAKHRLNQLGIGALLKNFHVAAHPRFGHRAIERRDRLHDKLLQALFHLQLRQTMTQPHHVMLAHQIKHVTQQITRFIRSARTALAADQRVKLGFRQRQKLSGAVTAIHEALDGTQALNLWQGVQPFAVAVTVRTWKAVAPLPHPQHVLGQTGVTLNGTDGQVGCNPGHDIWRAVH